ncbi:MAG: hypothetical protein LC790_07430, partial [Actinobacteria bacterium]|nr:hypothetical protein [Actinomycetota bacterium]
MLRQRRQQPRASCASSTAREASRAWSAGRASSRDGASAHTPERTPSPYASPDAPSTYRLLLR